MPPADEDDDWPTRYSWLDDDTDESEADQSLLATVESDAPAGAGQAARADADDADDHPAPETSAPADPNSDLAPDTVAGDSPSGDSPSGATASAGAAVPVAEDAEPEPGPGEPGPAPAEPEPESAEPEPEAVSADSEPPFADTQNPVPGDDLVAVLRGVRRYHRPDCVLIRFMPEGDIQRLPVAQAKADGCTPCAACQPVE